MGGLAFSSGDSPLMTPRMPKEVYERTKARCHDILQGLYSHVESPIEGPGKTDFGDIDLLVASPKSIYDSGDEALSIIGEALGAKRKILERGNGVAAHFAILWPTESSLANDSKGQYIQVDVRVCDTLEQLRWIMFKHGHGDLWNLVGSTIRPYGLTADETALWLRVPEIEESNKKRARIFLTSDPSKVLEFLGLKMEGFWDRPFDNYDELFEYAASCRLMYVTPTEKEPDSKKLKANDRRRMSYRPTFRKFVDDFLPECRRRGRFSVLPATREIVTKEAFAAFGAEDEFNARRNEFLLERQKDQIWNQTIKGNIPEADSNDGKAITYRSCLAKALKKIILEGDESYGVVPDESLKNVNGTFDLDKVLDFIKKRQKDVGDAAIARHRGENAERIRDKQTKAN